MIDLGTDDAHPSPADDAWLSEEMTLADIIAGSDSCCVCGEPPWIATTDSDGWGVLLCRRHAEAP